MCGIAGVIHASPPEKSGEILARMLEKIRHRGPDNDGTFIDERVAFGMRRLSIIDLAGGKQPIASQDGSLVIVFNGEIYNYEALREGLVKSGHMFKTHTDTEVILHLYEEKGEDAVHALRGMFTFIIYDMKRRRVFVARDPFGIKPLYYWKKDGAVTALASEIKSILEHPDYRPAVNEEAVFHYLSFQYNPLPETMFRDIFRLPPGSSLTIDAETGAAEEKRYWSVSFAQDERMNEQEGTGALVETLRDSVKHHLVSDVPVGAFLSGGVDSAVIVGAMRALYPEREIRTFTIGGKERNEFDASRPTAEALHTKHTEITLDPREYFAALPRIAWHFDEPVADPSAIALYFLAREAAKHVKVVLSGEGADEFFGGYNIYREPFALRRFTNLPRFVRAPFLFLTKLPIRVRGLNYIRRAMTPLSERYIGNAHVFSYEEACGLWRKNVPAKKDLSGVHGKTSGYSDPTAMQYVDIHTWLPGDILAKADKMTMAHSLELRVPFLDKEVWAFARTIPDRLKFARGKTKYLFRLAAETFVPKAASARKKLGFPVPLPEWLRRYPEWREPLLTHPFLASLFDIKKISALAEEHLSGKRNNARKLFVFIMLAAWHDAYFGKEKKGR